MMVTTKQASNLTGWITLVILSLPLVACGDGSASDKMSMVTKKSLNDDKEGTIKRTFSAAMSPLEDIGLRKRDIPDLLAQLSENPYFPPPKPFKCDGVKQEMADLDVLLGPDIDAPKVALSANAQYVEAGTEMVQDAVVGLVKSQVNVIPFRSIVRRITGADSHEKAVAKAVEGGKLRRAYLRGLAHAQFGDSCLPTPRIITAEQATAEKADSQDLELAKN